jgi:four helix bundle protein
MKPYERLLAWQASHRLVLGIYQATQRWPKPEQYGLMSQSRRAAFSIALNIAEGSARRGSREFRRFLDIALGSMSDLTYCLRLARELDYLGEAEWKEIEDQREEAGKLLWGLYQAMSRAKRPT